jgi:hypothetical protein
MKVTARDIAAIVKDTQLEMMRKRSSEPKESVIDKLINDEMNKMTSLVDGEEPGEAAKSGAEGSMSLDPGNFVDTAGWAGELNHAPMPHTNRSTKPPPMGRPARTTNAPPAGGEHEGLESLLEPERTGVHNNPDKKPPWALIIVIMIVLAAGAAAVVVLLAT